MLLFCAHLNTEIPGYVGRCHVVAVRFYNRSYCCLLCHYNSHVTVIGCVLFIVTIPGEDPEFVRAKYFFRDEFLVQILMF